VLSVSLKQAPSLIYIVTHYSAVCMSLDLVTVSGIVLVSIIISYKIDSCCSTQFIIL